MAAAQTCRPNHATVRRRKPKCLRKFPFARRHSSRCCEPFRIDNCCNGCSCRSGTEPCMTSISLNRSTRKKCRSTASGRTRPYVFLSKSSLPTRRPSGAQDHQVLALAATAQSRKRQARSPPRKSAVNFFALSDYFSDLPVCRAFKGYAMYSRGGRMKLAWPRLKRMQVQQRKPPCVLPSTCIDVVNVAKLRRLA